MKQYLLILILSILTSCGTKERESIPQNDRLELVPEPDKALREEYEKKQKAYAQHCPFSDPDTSVIGITLRDAESTLAILGKQTKLQGEPADTFYSSDRKQLLGLTVHPGDGYNQVSIFTISYAKNFKEKFPLVQAKEFETEKAIKLGLSRRELTQKLGACYETRDSTAKTVELYYSIETPDDSKTKLLDNHNMPSYYARYRLANDKLERIEFGFQYP